MTDFKVTGEASIPPDHIIEDIDSILEKLDKFAEKVDELDEKLNNLSRKNVDISIVIEGMDRLDRLKMVLDEMDEREWIVKIVIGDVIGSDRLDLLRADLDELTAKSHDVDVKVKVDGIATSIAQTEAMNRSLKNLDNNTKSAKSEADQFAFSMMALAPLLIPAAGAVAITAGALMGLASAFGAMLVPTAATLLVTKQLFTQITAVSTGLSAQAAAAAANTDSYSKMYDILEKNSAAFRTMDPFLKMVTTDFLLLKNHMKDFEKAVEPNILNLMLAGFRDLDSILQILEPMVKVTADALGNLITDFGNRLNDPIFQKWFADLDTNLGTLVTDWGTGVLNIIEGITAILDAFLPLGVKMSGGFLNMTQSFENWSMKLAQSAGFKKFVAEVEKDGPILLHLLGQIIIFVGHLFGALNNPGQVGGFLSVLDKLFTAANKFMSTHPGLAQAAVDLLLIGLAASKLLPMLSGLVGAFELIVDNPIVVILGLIAAGFFLAYTQSKTFHDWVDKNILPLFKKLGDAVNNAKKWLMGLWPDVQRLWQEYGNNILGIILAFAKGVEGIIEGAMKMIEGIIDIVLGLLTGNWTQVWKGFGELFSGAWTFIVNLLEAFSKILTGLVEILGKMLMNLIKTPLQWIENFFSTTFTTIRATVSGLFDKLVGDAAAWGSKFLGGIENWIKSVLSTFTNLPGDIVKALGDLGSLLWNAGVSVMKGFLNGLKSMWNDVTGFFSGLTNLIPDLKGPPTKDKDLLTDNGALIMDSLVKGLESKYSAVENSLQGFTKTIKNTYGNQFTKDISAQINASLDSTSTAVGRPLGSGGTMQASGTNVNISSGAIVVNVNSAEEAGVTLSRTLQGVARWGTIQTPAGSKR